MEENLRTLRIQHQFLMLLSFVAVLFAFVPDQTTIFQHAIWEANMLRRLGLRSYALTASNSFPVGENKKVADELRARLHLPADPQIYRVFYCEWPGEKASINLYLDFLNTEQTIAFLSTDLDEVTQLYRLAVQRYVQEFHDRPKKLNYVLFFP
jgi:hypothetical protein